jgi:hypothetical protein
VSPCVESIGGAHSSSNLGASGKRTGEKSGPGLIHAIVNDVPNGFVLGVWRQVQLPTRCLSDNRNESPTQAASLAFGLDVRTLNRCLLQQADEILGFASLRPKLRLCKIVFLKVA